MSLNSIQKAYFHAIYETDSIPLELLINDSLQFPAKSRVDIYRNNAIGTLLKILAQAFPVCVALVGERYFKQLANAHVSHHPSIHHDLNQYGQQFPETLKKLVESRDELHEMAYLVDVARLEWLVHQSYYAVDRAVFDIQGYAELSAEQQIKVSFKLADDVGLLVSSYPVYDIWLKHQPSFTSSTLVDKVISLDHQQYQYIRVQRSQWQIKPERIDEGVFLLLSAIEQGLTTLELTGFLENSIFDLAHLIQQGTVVGFELPTIQHHDIVR